MFVIGNMIMLIGSILMVVSGYIKSARKTVLVQSFQMFVMGIGNLFLGGFTGAFSNFFSIIRNIICYKGKLNNSLKVFFIIIQTTISIIINNLGIIGCLPIFASGLYTLFIDSDDSTLKKVMFCTNSMWLIYDIYIKSYTSSVFDVLSIIACVTTIYRINQDKEKNK